MRKFPTFTLNKKKMYVCNICGSTFSQDHLEPDESAEEDIAHFLLKHEFTAKQPENPVLCREICDSTANCGVCVFKKSIVKLNVKLAAYLLVNFNNDTGKVGSILEYKDIQVTDSDLSNDITFGNDLVVPSE